MITGKIRDVAIDQNGNIMVTTDYFDENGNFVHANGRTRYSFSVSDSIDDIMVQVEADIKDHASALIAMKHCKNKNALEINNIKKVAIGKEFSSSDGKLYTRNKVLTVNESSVISSVLRVN